MLFGLEVLWETRVAQLRSSIAVEGSEADSPTASLETVCADGNDTHVVEMARLQTGDGDSCLLVRG